MIIEDLHTHRPSSKCKSTLDLIKTGALSHWDQVELYEIYTSPNRKGNLPPGTTSVIKKKNA
jgi:hypothetical protein